MRLNQVLKAEQGIRKQAQTTITELHRVSQKSDLLNGHFHTYEAAEENGIKLAPDSHKVQFRCDEIIAQMKSAQKGIFDSTATRDWTNCQAKADVVVDGNAILKDVPAPYLLFLEKKLADLQTFVSKMVELDQAVDWSKDSGSGLYRSEPVKTHRTEKRSRPVELAPATKEHPAQVQLVTDDVLVGYWTKVRLSGAIAYKDKQQILERIEKLSRAVKYALEQANMTQAEDKQVGDTILTFIFG